MAETPGPGPPGPALAPAVREAGAAGPMWGKAKLAVLLRRDGHAVSESTTGRILKMLMKWGAVTPVPTLRRAGPRAASGLTPDACPRAASPQAPARSSILISCRPGRPEASSPSIVVATVQPPSNVTAPLPALPTAEIGVRPARPDSDSDPVRRCPFRSMREWGPPPRRLKSASARLPVQPSRGFRIQAGMSRAPCSTRQTSISASLST